MENMIKKLRIRNFKSIKDLKLDCSRINVFIGKPNVGKSNVLEALSLYGAGIVNGDIKKLVRFEKINNLFFYKDISKPIFIESNIANCQFQYLADTDDFGLFLNKSHNNFLEFRAKAEKVKSREDFNIEGDIFCQVYDSQQNRSSGNLERIILPVKRYEFEKQQSVNKFERKIGSLVPPYGRNLISVIESNIELRQEISDIFKEYNLEFVLDSSDQKIEIQRRIENFVDKIPYSLTADTLQRIIFHYAAILSNKNAVLLFEEPENHSYPPYIRSLAEKIIDSKENQFFITTHSPYLFNTLLSDSKEGEVSVFVTKFNNHETQARKLSEKELSEIMDYGVDVFFNLKHFEDE